MDTLSELAKDSQWERWSIHVLNELERLNESYTTLSSSLTEIKEKAFILAKQNEEITRLTREVDGLKMFKTQAVTVWGIAQFVLGTFLYFVAKG